MCKKNRGPMDGALEDIKGGKARGETCKREWKIQAEKGRRKIK